MSSSRQVLRGLGFASLFAAAALSLSACQVRPLYGNMSGANRSVAISEADTRVEQVVRNDLVFAFGGGSGEPANASYRLDLDVVAVNQGVLAAGANDEFTAARVVVIGKYVMTDSASGEVLFSGERRAVAAVDNPDQEYADVRATRDAENRAAREAAAFLNADIAGKFAAKGL
jgi:LPS-assembly lipoprotein